MTLTIRGFKVTDNTGHAFPTKSDVYKLEAGKVVKADDFDTVSPCSNGIFLGDTLEHVVDLGIDAANCDPRYRKDPNLLPRDGVKVFEVEGHDAVRLDHRYKGDIKCRDIKVLREVPLSEIIEEVGRKGTWRAMEFVGACIPPALMPLLFQAAEENLAGKGGVYAGANINPKNPSRILPGDVVGLNDLHDKLNRQTKDFFSTSRECVLDRIGLNTHFAQVRNELGETHRLNIAFLKRLGPGPSSGTLPEFSDDRSMLLPCPGGPGSSGGSA